MQAIVWGVDNYMARSKRRKKLSPFTVAGVMVLCCVLCGSFTYSIASLMSRLDIAKQKKEELKKRLEEQVAAEVLAEKKLKEEKAEIKDYESYVKTKEYTEEVARDKLGLVYPNEIIFEPNDK